MRSVYKFLFVFVGLISFISFSGCDGELPLNIPFTKEFTLAGSIPVTKTETINFLDYPEYQNNEGKIKDLNYVDGAFRVISIDNTSLTANVHIVVKGIGGITLFEKNITNVNLANYITTPYPFNLSQSEIDAVNAYLSITTNRTFTGIVEVTGATGSINARAAVDIVLEAVTETGN